MKLLLDREFGLKVGLSGGLLLNKHEIIYYIYYL